MTRQSQRADMRHKPAKANALQSLPSVPAPRWLSLYADSLHAIRAAAAASPARPRTPVAAVWSSGFLARRAPGVSDPREWPALQQAQRIHRLVEADGTPPASQTAQRRYPTRGPRTPMKPRSRASR